MILLLALIELVLIATNYTPGTFLMGWDNIMPEFNFPANIMRNLVGVWQENRGLGLYDGMAHNANLLYTLFLWVLSFVLPISTLRYVFTFGTHFAGTIGMYVLLSMLLKKHWTAFVGALFYQLNLATIQMFYAPLEAFTVHFAALPWLAYTLLRYYEDRTKRSLLLFFFVSLLSTPQYFVIPLLLPIGLLLGSLSIGKPLRLVLIAGAGFLLIQSFWLLPFVWGIPQNAPIIEQAKINQLSSPEVFDRNRAYGDLVSTVLLRGFNLDFFDTSFSNEFQFFMEAWRTHVFSIVTTILGFVLAAFGLFGLSKINIRLLPFSITLVLSFLALGNDAPIIRSVTEFIRDHVPFIGEAYRFPFTKFSLLFAFSFGIIISYALTRLSKYIYLLIVASILYIALPSFTGNFLYKNLRIAPPKQYFELSNYMESINPTARIALLPQPAYWSWRHYRWGYRGSGFLWYMLAQPTMDRAFDPWSNENENYYWELSRAIYARDVNALEAVFDKYDIRYILFDDTLVTTSHNRALYSDEIRAMLATLPTITIAKNFQDLILYERTNEERRSYIAIKSDLPTVSSTYNWTDHDAAFEYFGDYKGGTEGIIYPYRSLFTKRSVEEREFSLELQGELVYDTNQSKTLNASSVTQCGPLNQGKAVAETMDSFLHFTSLNQRGCLSFGMPNLWHRDGYLVTVESRNTKGRPLLFSLINQTAKHVELETYLPRSPEWQTSHFILPPLAFDGLGYTVYIANDSIGRHESINDIGHIRVYKIPYQELVSMRIGDSPSNPTSFADFSVEHPNPAYYRVTLMQPHQATLILSQAFDPGWTAWERTAQFPYFRRLDNHVLVNNWANGWELKGDEKDVVVFFWPQILQWIGFGLMIILVV